MKVRNQADLLALWEGWSLAERQCFEAKTAYLNALAHVQEDGFDEESPDSSCTIDDAENGGEE